MICTRSNLIVEVRKFNFSSKAVYAIKMYHEENGERVDLNGGQWSQTTTATMIKAYLKRENIGVPSFKDLKFFSNGFDYSYAWFDGNGNIIGK